MWLAEINNFLDCLTVEVDINHFVPAISSAPWDAGEVGYDIISIESQDGDELRSPEELRALVDTHIDELGDRVWEAANAD